MVTINAIFTKSIRIRWSPTFRFIKLILVQAHNKRFESIPCRLVSYIDKMNNIYASFESSHTYIGEIYMVENKLQQSVGKINLFYL